uniref:Uncharacterized protein n=1 Tax=Planktothrix pseudagardhii TaxID=132604 RepID=A0A9W4GBL3_9CYAN|nr:hypothetical protein NO713_05224 [Planktothrix pseudagardhii]
MSNSRLLLDTVFIQALLNPPVSVGRSQKLKKPGF